MRGAWAAAVIAVVATGLVAHGQPAAAGAWLGVFEEGPREQRVVALTIDDGWSASACGRILEVLERRYVPATFFPVGQAVGAHPAFWRSVAARGYPIGNHTATHTLLAGEPVAVQQAAIAAGSAWIKRVTGRAPIPVLRPPAGEWDANTVAAASRVGMRLVLLWDRSFGDTGPGTNEENKIAKASRGRPGSVILLHCRDISARILERVIDAYLGRGFEFVTVPQLFGFKGPAPEFPAKASLPTAPATPCRRPAGRSGDSGQLVAERGADGPVAMPSGGGTSDEGNPSAGRLPARAAARSGSREGPGPAALVLVLFGVAALGVATHAGSARRWGPRDRAGPA